MIAMSPALVHMRYLVLALVLTMSAIPAMARPKSHIYSVIFEVSLDESGKIDSFKISKVIDVTAMSTEPVNIAIPDAYVAAARESFAMQPRSSELKHFYIYRYYNPRLPDNPDVGPY